MERQFELPFRDVTPSREDRVVTDRLKAAGQILGIDVVDHIIHGDGTPSGDQQLPRLARESG